MTKPIASSPGPTPNGCMVEPFAKIASGVTSQAGITFDRVGTFDNDMVLTDVTGNVFRVDAVGTISHIASLEKHIESPAVVPATLGPEIWVAAECNGAVYPINAGGKVYLIIITDNIPGAENVTIIPTTPTNLGSSGGSLLHRRLSDSNRRTPRV